MLLDWYADHAQQFPWREGGDPYAALVAAVCSQQTQMARVLVLYERWMAAFPTLDAAAGASSAEVLRAWGRGGYPRRALMLHQAARRCMAEHGGVVPPDPAALLALPGVGPFTTAIVRSYGYEEDAPAVDTNVVRVLGRLVHGELQPATGMPARVIEATAARLLRPGTALRWNPALMDYGARVCLPRPRCEQCVVALLCAARPRFAAGEVAPAMRAQSRFEGSDRQLRGRLLAELRASAEPLCVERLIDTLADREDAGQRPRRLLDALATEGLAWVEGGWCGLGERAG